MIELWATIIGVVLTFIFTMLIAHGASKAKALEADRRIREMERELEKIRDKFDNYVSHMHLNEVVLSMKDNYRDLKGSVDKVLELLTARS